MLHEGMRAEEPARHMRADRLGLRAGELDALLHAQQAADHAGP
jgi:hypothetical protein